MFTLAHASDFHRGPVTWFGPRYWNVKRLLGLANWQLTRRQVYKTAVLDALMADLAAQAPDHVALTGDLVNLGLPQEHETALRWLIRIGEPRDVTVVPGNHDIYTKLGRDEGAMRWAAYMRATSAVETLAGDHAAVARAPDVPSRDAEDVREDARRPGRFPFLKRVGGGKVALIGVNSAVPTRPFYASGEVGDAQFEALEIDLAATKRAGLRRVVLIHHPPLPGQADARRGLRDSARMADVLRQHGADLVLHGHNHENMLSFLEPASGPPIPIVGAPCASMGERHKGKPLARYNLYRFDADVPGAPIEMIGRGLGDEGRDGGAIHELERRTLRS
ncbi:MAG: metallophosphoesterase [Pseudomonadota bacterium]